MDDGLSAAVLKVFVQLYKDGPDLQVPSGWSIGIPSW